jgi:hypothetical protein
MIIKRKLRWIYRRYGIFRGNYNRISHYFDTRLNMNYSYTLRSAFDACKDRLVVLRKRRIRNAKKGIKTLEKSPIKRIIHKW